MELHNSFVIPVPVEEAWPVLLDIERLGSCVPGATIDAVRDDEFDGRVRVKLGPISVSYSGSGTFTEIDKPGKRVVLSAKGSEAKGGGSADATITATLTDNGDGQTSVKVDTDLAITGRPAQFGRGVIENVSGKIIGQFADNLAAELTSTSPIAAPVHASATPERAQASPAPSDDTGIDGLSLIGGLVLSKAKQAWPILAVAGSVTLAGIVMSLKRRKSTTASALAGPTIILLTDRAAERLVNILATSHTEIVS